MSIEAVIKELKEKRDEAYAQIADQYSKANPNPYIIKYCEGKVYAFTRAINELSTI